MFSLQNQRSTKGASKMRRDQINSEIGNVRDLLPVPETSRQRLSQLQIMSLACIYIRKSNYFNRLFGSPMGVFDSSFEFLKALTGFFLATTRDGKLLYISDNVTEYLGPSMFDMMTQGDSLYDIIDKRDHSSVQAQLLNNTYDGSGGPAMRSFFCRMNVSRSLRRASGINDQKVMHVRGQFVQPALRDHYSNQAVFLAVCCPVITPETKDETTIECNTLVFKSVHSLEMKYQDLEHRGEYHLGYSESEIRGRSWYEMVHPCDLQEAKEKHKQLILSTHGTYPEMGCMLTVRMITSTSAWIWVNVVMHVRKPSIADNGEASVVCINQVIGEHEIGFFQLQSQLYSNQMANSQDYYYAEMTPEVPMTPAEHHDPVTYPTLTTNDSSMYNSESPYGVSLSMAVSSDNYYEQVPPNVQHNPQNSFSFPEYGNELAPCTMSPTEYGAVQENSVLLHSNISPQKRKQNGCSKPAKRVRHSPSNGSCSKNMDCMKGYDPGSHGYSSTERQYWPDRNYYQSEDMAYGGQESHSTQSQYCSQPLCPDVVSMMKIKTSQPLLRSKIKSEVKVKTQEIEPLTPETPNSKNLKFDLNLKAQVTGVPLSILTPDSSPVYSPLYSGDNASIIQTSPHTTSLTLNRPVPTRKLGLSELVELDYSSVEEELKNFERFLSPTCLDLTQSTAGQSSPMDLTQTAIDLSQTTDHTKQDDLGSVTSPGEQRTIMADFTVAVRQCDINRSLNGNDETDFINMLEDTLHAIDGSGNDLQHVTSGDPTLISTDPPNHGAETCELYQLKPAILPSPSHGEEHYQ